MFCILIQIFFSAPCSKYLSLPTYVLSEGVSDPVSDGQNKLKIIVSVSPTLISYKIRIAILEFLNLSKWSLF